MLLLDFKPSKTDATADLISSEVLIIILEKTSRVIEANEDLWQGVRFPGDCTRDNVLQ